MAADVPRPVSAERGHRWFAAAYERKARREERDDYTKETRTRVAGGATGRVLEIGAGTGFNFPYYSDDAAVVATEPDPEMLRRAELRAREHGIELRPAPAERLSFPADSFDTVVATGVFCAVDDPAAALAEVGRVLRPGGLLRFWEHVRTERAARRMMQRALDPIHFRLFRCHIGRDTLRVMSEAGFEIEELDRLRQADVVGVARKR
ncbi:MAG TPA: class I SAM-dependent methyltransferase [Actinomycetota bacterium]|nr:class I SAM-dependent methyltransferase [Actinomycetota bacterium]